MIYSFFSGVDTVLSFKYCYDESKQIIQSVHKKMDQESQVEFFQNNI